MDSFRLSLLAIGAALIAFIYLWGRWRRRQEAREHYLDDPLTSDDEADNGGDEWEIIPLPRQAERGAPMEAAQLKELAGMSGREARQGLSADEVAALSAFQSEQPDVGGAAPAELPVEELLVLTVIAQEGEAFTGPTLSDLFEQLGLEYGDMRVFHRIYGPERESVFSLVSIVEPGYFELEKLPDLRLPGLALFMRLPGPRAGGAAFDDFLATARALASALEGRLADQQRRPLTEESIAKLRARAARFRQAVEA